ncbi:MAG: DUF2232 domain-containing protein, partial [Peptostreptococcaceae bacterium]
RFLCCSKLVFYGCIFYIIIIEVLNVFNIDIQGTYLKTILISIKYLCVYFVIRDGYTIFQNYLLSKCKNIFYIRIISVISLIMLVFVFKLILSIIIILNIILDKKLNIRTKQISIVNNYVSKL